jgi:hypothetical protein
VWVNKAADTEAFFGSSASWRLFHWQSHINAPLATQAQMARASSVFIERTRPVLLCLLLQYLIQSCARGRIVEDMCYEIRRVEACED